MVTILTFDSLPHISIGWEYVRNLWILLPVIPLVGVVLCLFAQYFLPRNIDKFIFYTAIAVHIIAGITVLLSGTAYAMESREIPVSVWDFPIVFRIDEVKLHYLAVLLVPLIIALPKYEHLNVPYLRVVFLFY